MQLRHLGLRNIRSYESADLLLGPGTTLITGDVGSGKTSLLHAVEMALFGFAEVEPTYLVRHQSSESMVELELEGGGHRYQFGRKFRRRTRRGREVFELESASYAEDGQRAAYSVTEIRERAIRLLGFPDNPNPRAHSDLWRWAVYVPQERMREVLVQEPQERLETVRKALGLEQYRTAADNGQLLATELRRLAELRESQARGMDHYADDLPRLRTELEERTSDHARWAEEHNVRTRETATLDQAVAEVDRRRQQAEGDAGEERQLTERIRAEGALIARIDQRRADRQAEARKLEQSRPAARLRETELEGARAELARLDVERATARADRDAAAELLASLAAAEAGREAAERGRDAALASVERARVEREGLRSESEALQSEGPQREPPAPTPRHLTEIDELIDAARSSEEARVAELARLDQVLADTDELLRVGVCPRCHQSVESANFASHRGELETQRAVTQTALDGCRSESGRLREERASRERYERNHQRWTELLRSRSAAGARLGAADERLGDARARAAEAERELARAESRVAELRPRGATAQSQIDRLSKVEAAWTDMSQAIERLTAAREEDRRVEHALERLVQEIGADGAERADRARSAAELEGRLVVIRARLATLASLEVEASHARQRLEDARAGLATAAREAARSEALVETLRRQERDAEVRLAERAQLQEEGRHRRELAGWFGQSFREGVLALERRLLGRAQAEFERALARYFALLVEEPGLVARCDPAFSPSVEIDGEWTPPEALSGGERTALALAFRLALAGVVRSVGRLNLQTLILDEPTDGFSPEQVARMGELLETLAIPQVLVVSHEPQLAAVADRIVRVEKRSGRSTLSTGSLPGPTHDRAPSPSTPPTRKRTRTRRLDPPVVPPSAPTT